MYELHRNGKIAFVKIFMYYFCFFLTMSSVKSDCSFIDNFTGIVGGWEKMLTPPSPCKPFTVLRIVATVKQSTAG